MAFKVSHDKWLQVEADRVESLILMPKWWRRAWSPESLKEALHGVGLKYSMAEVKEINDELHARGIVEDTSE